MEKIVIKGELEFWSETGTEGGYWCVYDVGNDEVYKKTGKKDYKYQLMLKDGDKLTIFDKQDREKIVWDGVIDFKWFNLFTKYEPVYSCWIHNIQRDISLQDWSGWFWAHNPCILTRTE